jgi:hypothetical protein
MGLMTELFVARDEEAKTYDHTSAGRFSSLQLGGLTNLEFETLWAILAAKEWSAETHALHEVASTKGTWTFKFPEVYLDRLRRLEPTAISAAATSWAATDEVSCEPAEVEPVIAQLASIARSLSGGDRGLFLWTSL